jgi:hypothetical protein
LNIPISSVSSEVLVHLVQKGSNRGFPAGLSRAVTGDIQIWDAMLIHQWLDNGRNGHAVHACKRIDIHHPVEALMDIFKNGCDTNTRFSPKIKGE